MRRILLSLAASLGLLAGLLSPAAAQVNAQINPTRLDAAITVCPLSYSSGTTFAVNVQTTATCTPPAGQYVYIVGLSFDVCTDGTGTGVNQVNFTTTNVTGSPLFTFSIAATASICQHWSEPVSSPLKSTAAGTAVTVVSPAAALHNSYLPRVYAYFAP